MQRNIHRCFTVLVAGSLFVSAALPRAIAAPSLPLGQSVSVDLTAIPPQRTSLPKAIARRVQQEIAKTYKVPANQLRITAAQARTWNSCLGVPAPNVFCTRIAISGWQVIVEAPQYRWVYHVADNGSQIALNQAASLMKQQPPLGLQFFAPDDMIATPGDDVLFQSVAQGGITGQTVITKLTKDGTISKQRFAPNIRSRPVVVKHLTPKQLEAFLNQVQGTRFNNRGLRYLPSCPRADLITTQINSGGAVVEYVDSTQAQLPATLQQVIEAWQTVARSQ